MKYLECECFFFAKVQIAQRYQQLSQLLQKKKIELTLVMFLETVLEVQVKACSSRDVCSSVIAFLFENPADAAVLNGLTFYTGVSNAVIVFLKRLRSSGADPVILERGTDPAILERTN